MSNNPNLTDNTISVFIDLVTKSIESGAGLSTKMEGIAKTQERQDAKLDGLMVTVAEIKQMNSNLGQRIDGIERETRDHEARLRILEPSVGSAADYRRRVEALERNDDTREKDIVAINSKLTLYIGMATTGLLIAQFVIATFIAPWMQGIFFGN